jgi:tetratricopeptide (TPR) repeat protein
VYLRRFDDSLAEFELALRLNSNFALAQGYYGLGLAYVGRWQEGVEAARRALRLSPRDPFSAIYNGVAAYAEFVPKRKTPDIARTLFNVKVSNYSYQIKYERRKNQVLRKTLISSRKRVQQGSLSKIR